MEGRRCRPVRPGCRGLLLGELPGEGRALLGRHLVELLAELVEVLLGLLGIAALVRVGLAGRGPGQRTAERGHRRGPLLRRRVDLGAHRGLDRSEAGQVHVELVRPVAQLTGEVAQVLGQSRARILGVGALRLELVGEVVEALGLLVRGLADLSLLGDRRVLRVRDEQHGRKQERGDDRRDRRLAREPRPEQVLRRAPKGRNGIGTLAPDEAVGLGGLVDWAIGRHGIGLDEAFGRRAGRRREADRELERAGDAVAQPTLGVECERGLTQRRTGADDGDEPAHRADDRDGRSGDRRPFDGHEPRDGPQHELGHHIAASASHVRRTIRRTHRRRRCEARPARTASSAGSSGPSMTPRGSTGT